MKKVKFASSRETDLIPGGWIFGASCGDLGNALTNLLGIKIKDIKQKGGKKTEQREALINLIRKKDEEGGLLETASSMIIPNADDDLKSNNDQQDEVTQLRNENKELRQELEQVRRQLLFQQQQPPPPQQPQHPQSPSVYSADDTTTVPSIVPSPMYMPQIHCIQNQNHHHQQQQMLNNDNMSHMVQNNDTPLYDGMPHCNNQSFHPHVSRNNFSNAPNQYNSNVEYNPNAITPASAYGGIRGRPMQNRIQNEIQNRIQITSPTYTFPSRVVINRSPPPTTTVYAGFHHSPNSVASTRYNPMRSAHDNNNNNNHNDDNNFMDQSQTEYLNANNSNSIITDSLSMGPEIIPNIQLNSHF